MAAQVQNFAKKNFGLSSIQPMPDFPSTTTAWWNSQEQQIHQCLSKSLSLKVGSPPQAYQEEKHAVRQLKEPESSSTQLTKQTYQEVAAIGGNNFQEQCISSDPEDQVKPVLASPQVDISPSVAHIPYAYEEPYVNGLHTAYGPQAIIQPQVIGIAPAWVPLPIELAEDGPIYVNTKQYHGILRRRQIRARLEAQNKLLKSRKPYLHESRHRHAVNRVRGSGGRFLGTKKTQPPNPTLITNSFDLGSSSVNQKERNKLEASSTSFSNNDVIVKQPNHRFSNISSNMGVNRTKGSIILQLSSEKWE